MKFQIFAVTCWALLWGVAAAQFPSQDIELTDRLPLGSIGGGSGSDIWGWTDPQTGKDYAIMGRANGTAFVDVTDPYNAVYLGNLPTVAGTSVWRDIKTYQNHAYIVADNVGPHGLQVFDLTNLRGVNSPQTFSSTTVDSSFRTAHNIAINEDSGYAYVVGGDIEGGRALVYDLSTPNNPSYLGPVAVDGYIHDLQVVNYQGPDPDHVGREVAFTASVNDFVLIDVTDKSAPFRITEVGHSLAEYIHQGWLSEDHTMFYLNDELDGPWTHRWDVTDLDNPIYRGSYSSVGSSPDHNLYVKGKYVYQANYTTGIRVGEITNPTTGDFTEVAWLDSYPSNNSNNYDGAWSIYPFFESGTIIHSDINSGLFVSRVTERPADFNADGYVDCDDINQLTSAVAADDDRPWFDLTGDGEIDGDDVDEWLVLAGNENLGSPYIDGDINLDGVVDISDLNIWSGNKFTQTSHWCSGDQNADGVADVSDLNIWSGNKFASSTVAAVPEPAFGFAWLLAMALFVRSRTQR